MDMSKDICYFGIRSYEEEEMQLIKDEKVLVFEASECVNDNLDDIEGKMNSHFK